MNWRNHVVPTLRTPCTCLATFLRGPPSRGPSLSCPRLRVHGKGQARGDTCVRGSKWGLATAVRYHVHTFQGSLALQFMREGHEDPPAVDPRDEAVGLCGALGVDRAVVRQTTRPALPCAIPQQKKSRQQAGQ